MISWLILNIGKCYVKSSCQSPTKIILSFSIPIISITIFINSNDPSLDLLLNSAVFGNLSTKDSTIIRKLIIFNAEAPKLYTCVPNKLNVYYKVNRSFVRSAMFIFFIIISLKTTWNVKIVAIGFVPNVRYSNLIANRCYLQLSKINKLSADAAKLSQTILSQTMVFAFTFKALKLEFSPLENIRTIKIIKLLELKIKNCIKFVKSIRNKAKGNSRKNI